MQRDRKSEPSLGGMLVARIGFRGISLALSIAAVLLIWLVGTIGFLSAGENWRDAVYRALQLFGLNFEEPPASRMNMAIEAARFAAPVVLVAALVKLLADGIGQKLQRFAHVYLNGRPRDVVIGFDPVSRAIGQRLLARGAAVTWVAALDGSDEARDNARRDAERDGGLLIIGDPSAKDIMSLARIDRARRVFVRLESDLASLDAAEAIRVWLQQGRGGKAGKSRVTPDVRIFTDSPELSGKLAHAAAHGFVSGRDVSAFNLRAEGARRLVLRARFDRTALLLGQERVHVVIAGCGQQGETLLEEVLTLCLRARLKPPLVTVIDGEADRIRSRVRRRSPALLDPHLGVDGWLPPRFIEKDVELLDFSALDLRADPASEDNVPVTAWVFCSQSDELNLRAALICHSASQRRHIDGAPIFARVWSGHKLGSDELTQVNTFGTMDDALDQTRALDDDPDAIPKQLHAAYLRTEAVTASIPSAYRTFQSIDQASGAAAQNWEALMASKQSSNRRAFFHAAMKLSDLGFDWCGGEETVLPRFNSEQQQAFEGAEQELAKGGFTSGQTSQQLAFLAAMINEHDRWTIDRAMDGWQWASERDEARQLHPDMRSFHSLGAITKAFDGVLLRALLASDPSRDHERPQAIEHATVSLRIDNGATILASAPVASWGAASEIIITLPAGNPTRPEKTDLDLGAAPLAALRGAIRQAVAAPDRVCRLVLVFPAPPTRPVLTLANDLAAAFWARGRDVHPIWAWSNADGHCTRPVIAPQPVLAFGMDVAALSAPDGAGTSQSSELA